MTESTFGTNVNRSFRRQQTREWLNVFANLEPQIYRIMGIFVTRSEVTNRKHFGSALAAVRILEPNRCFCIDHGPRFVLICLGDCRTIKALTGIEEDDLHDSAIDLLETFYHTRQIDEIRQIRAALALSIQLQKIFILQECK